MNTKGVNFQPSKRGQFSAAVDKKPDEASIYLLTGTTDALRLTLPAGQPLPFPATLGPASSVGRASP